MLMHMHHLLSILHTVIHIRNLIILSGLIISILLCSIVMVGTDIIMAKKCRALKHKCIVSYFQAARRHGHEHHTSFI